MLGLMLYETKGPQALSHHYTIHSVMGGAKRNSESHRCGVFLGMLALVPLIAAEPKNPFSEDARRSYENIKTVLRNAAQAMPEEKYGFRPQGAERTFGEVIAHVADLQTEFCSAVKGDKSTGGQVLKQTKADLSAAIEASFNYCDAAYKGMTDRDGARIVDLFGKPITLLGLLNGNVAYDNQMYGLLQTYLRMNGIK